MKHTNCAPPGLGGIMLDTPFKITQDSRLARG